MIFFLYLNIQGTLHLMKLSLLAKKKNLQNLF